MSLGFSKEMWYPLYILISLTPSPRLISKEETKLVQQGPTGLPRFNKKKGLDVNIKKINTPTFNHKNPIAVDWEEFANEMPKETVLQVEQFVDMIVNTSDQGEKFRLLSSLYNQLFGTTLYSWCPRTVSLLATLPELKAAYQYNPLLWCTGIHPMAKDYIKFETPDSLVRALNEDATVRDFMRSITKKLVDGPLLGGIPIGLLL